MHSTMKQTAVAFRPEQREAIRRLSEVHYNPDTMTSPPKDGEVIRAAVEALRALPLAHQRKHVEAEVHQSRNVVPRGRRKQAQQ
ncbi:MAG: hypothetical protein GF331_19700 [Chitinivibrionales bacterium]|nr:hypothetical protein [Chitinivibrionales bacterium]